MSITLYAKYHNSRGNFKQKLNASAMGKNGILAFPLNNLRSPKIYNPKWLGERRMEERQYGFNYPHLKSKTKRNGGHFITITTFSFLIAHDN